MVPPNIERNPHAFHEQPVVATGCSLGVVLIFEQQKYERYRYFFFRGQSGRDVALYTHPHQRKVKFTLQGHEGPEREQRYSSTLSLTSVLEVNDNVPVIRKIKN